MERVRPTIVRSVPEGLSNRIRLRWFPTEKHWLLSSSVEFIAGEATVAVRLESTVDELIRTIHAHPTMAEAIGEAAHAVHGAAIHL